MVGVTGRTAVPKRHTAVRLADDESEVHVMADSSGANWRFHKALTLGWRLGFYKYVTF